MHDNIIQLLFLDSIKNKIELLDTYRKRQSTIYSN